MKSIKNGLIRFSDIMEDQPVNRTIQDAFAKCYSVLQNHDHVVASVSGGSDSDVWCRYSVQAMNTREVFEI